MMTIIHVSGSPNRSPDGFLKTVWHFLFMGSYISRRIVVSSVWGPVETQLSQLRFQ